VTAAAPDVSTPDDDVVAGRPGGPRVARITAVVVGVVLVAFIALLATRKSASDQPDTNPLVGRAVPALSGTTLDGSSFDVDTLRGKWVVVNFAASWCVPCTIEQPELVAFRDEHKAKGDAELVSVGFQDDPANLKAFFAKGGADWPVVVGNDQNAAVDFGITAVPESFLVAPNGEVVAHFDMVSRADLDAVINQFSAASDASSGASTATTAGTP
jgi:cytochrome c biogenesis protein CcmG/thiol:disulfide interchange protein DsbE